MLDKIAFLDRDGVINEKMPENDYVKTWDEFCLRPGAAAGLHRLREAGYKLVLVTNQRGIARKMMTAAALADIHGKMQQLLQQSEAAFDAIFYCPHDKGECDCRKPKIGMFLQAETQFAVDKQHSLMIGDSDSDIRAGQNYGLPSYRVGPDQTLEEVVKAILQGTAQPEVEDKGE